MRHVSWELVTVNVYAPAVRVRKDVKSDKCDILSEQQHAIHFLFYVIPGYPVYLEVQESIRAF